MDWSIEGTIFHNGVLQPGCLGITNGTITEVKKTLRGPTHISVGSKAVLPAGLDLHVHFRDPGFPHKEDFGTGSCAAAFGGITCVFDMPNTSPPTATVQALQEKRRRARQRSYVDFGLYAAVIEPSRDSLRTLGQHCSGFKIFLGESTNAVALPSSSLQKAFAAIASTGKRTMVHAEDDACLRRHAGPEASLTDHARRRPAQCEEGAIIEVLSALPSSPVHLCHLSSAVGLQAIRGHGTSLSVGCTPHHLLLDSTMDVPYPGRCKVNPPLRAPSDREALWDAVTSGAIDVLESDHAPHTVDEKDADFDSTPSGVPGVETMYPLFLALAKQGALALPTVIRLCCERPAALSGLPKGSLAVGADADFIVVDLKDVREVSHRHLHSRCGWTPFEGRPALFPTDVYLRGVPIIEGGSLAMSPGKARCVDGA